MSESLPCFIALAKAATLAQKKLSGHGLDFSDFIILHALAQAPEGKLRRIDLAERLGMTPSGITRMLLPLEKLGIITRDMGDDDARARYSALTPAGKELFADASATIANKLEDLVPAGKEPELAQLCRLLGSLPLD